MEVKKYIRNLRLEVDKVLAEGQKAIDAEALRRALLKVEEAPEKQGNAVDEFRLEQLRAHYAEKNELTKALFAFGSAAMKSLFLINGGASVALLSLMGSLYSKSVGDSLIEGFNNSLACFVSGLLFSAMMPLFAYCSQYHYCNDSEKPGRRYHRIAFVMGGLAVIAFVAGAWLSYKAFNSC